jgi:hypothetical protein
MPCAKNETEKEIAAWIASCNYYTLNVLPQAMRGLVGLVFLFDLYTIYQYLLIHRIRRQLLEREELFHLISNIAADMIAVVDMNGKRIYNSLFLPTAFEQIHPDDRERVKKAANEARLSGIDLSALHQPGPSRYFFRVRTSRARRVVRSKPRPQPALESTLTKPYQCK